MYYGARMIKTRDPVFVALVCILLAGCTATIDKGTFFPREELKAPHAKLVAPTGYTVKDALIDLPSLGRVRAVLLDHPNSDTTIIYSAGNGGFVDSDSSSKATANLAAVSNADIILYDYPGRGGTTVPDSIEAMVAVGPQLISRFKAMGWMGKGPVYAYGFSFGGGMAAAMSRVGGFSGLMIEGSATDYKAIGRDFIPLAARPFVRLKIDPELKSFDYFGYVLAARTPVLLLSSVDDHTVRPHNMQRLAQQLLAQGVKVTFQSTSGDHGAALGSPEGQVALRAFLATP